MDDTARTAPRRSARAWRAAALSVAAGVLLVIAPQLASAQATNLVPNPGCESGTTGYAAANATLTASTTVRRTGKRACRAASTGGTYYLIRPTYTVKNPAVGSTYTASAWVRADTNSGRRVYAAMQERGGPAAARTVNGAVVTLTTQWQQVPVSITVGSAGRTDIDLYVAANPGRAREVFYADDFSLTASTTSPPTTTPPPTSPPPPTATPPPTGTPPSPTSPSGAAMPVGNLTGWRQIFAEDFTVGSATGSWGASCATEPNAADKIVYTGAGGTRWRTYPDCFKDTYLKRPYRSDQVLSTHDGVLDFYLRNVDGVPAGANPSPVINDATSSQYQNYGRYTARLRLDTTSLSEYKVAWLLWPEDDAQWQCAESDFPENGLADTTTNAFHHYGCGGAQDAFSAAADLTAWHTYTQEWAPGVRRYYLDGVLVGTSTKPTYAGPQRWQLQTETTGDGTHSGHLLVDWVAVYAYQP